MGKAYDIASYNELASRIAGLRKLVKPGDLSKIGKALDDLRGLPFPPGYLDEVRQDMFSTLRGGVAARASVYLAFYGGGEIASHLKIGMAKSVRSRLSGIKTGNPLPMLWAFSSEFPSRAEAAAVERALLGHLAELKVHGEWMNVSGLSLPASEAIVESLAEVASVCVARRVLFTRFLG